MKSRLLLLCVVIAAMLSSCRTIKEIEYRDVYVHDTVKIEKQVHDSIKIVKTEYDSIDHYYENVIYIDTNGVVHQRELERLTKYIRESNEEFHQKESEYMERIAELERQLSETQTTVEVKKPLNWFQKTMMGLGFCFILTVVGYVVYIIVKLKTGIKKYG